MRWFADSRWLKAGLYALLILAETIQLGNRMRRREFVGGLISAAALPAIVHAQGTAIPVIGILHSGTLDAFRAELDAFRDGLAKFGFVEGQNVSFEYRAADNQLDRLSALAEDLVRRRVAVIFSSSNVAPTLAAKTATTSIPIVFYMGADPVSTGVVASLAHPGGNITGVTVLASELFGKRLQLLHELVPRATRIGYLVNQANPAYSANTLRENTETAQALGLQLSILHANDANEVDRTFTVLADKKVEAILLGPDTSYLALRDQIVSLATRYAIPVSYSRRDFVDAGGLISYGTDFIDVYHRCAAYVVRILRGEAPQDLPVQQPTGFALVLNQKAAKQIRLEIPATLLVRADEVIE
jgi:putative ABC transport system substrate-binding protein